MFCQLRQLIHSRIYFKVMWQMLGQISVIPVFIFYTRKVFDGPSYCTGNVDTRYNKGSLLPYALVSGLEYLKTITIVVTLLSKSLVRCVVHAVLMKLIMYGIRLKAKPNGLMIDLRLTCTRTRSRCQTNVYTMHSSRYCRK